ncbi:MAG: endopeptidase La [Candidatus Zixiibacteriota bacterium]
MRATKFPYGTETIDIKSRLPVIPLRDVVVFPHMVYPLLVGREFTLKALNEAMRGDKLVFLLAQRVSNIDAPRVEDLYSVGVVARVLQIMKMPNSTVKILVEGLARATVKSMDKATPHLSAMVQVVVPSPDEKDREMEALARTVSENFTEYVRLNRRVPDDVLVSLASIELHYQLADTIAAHLVLKLEQRQRVLEALTVREQFQVLNELLTEEVEILKIEQKIDGSVRESMSRSQREFYLQQQLKAIRDELGQFEEPGAEVDSFTGALEKKQYPEAVKARAEEEIKKLSKMHPYSAEAAVVRGYIEWLVGLPWNSPTTDRTSFQEVTGILDADHFGLQKAKKRIIEHLAVMRLAGKVKGPILCLVGPPGAGKTSIGKSIARALGRNFVRMSLGGVHDEAEIRGHRKTYIGAMPGRMIQALKKANSSNPVFLLDEIDKLGKDFRGDPASALLEVLDPEQNSTFTDNYLEVEFDLSSVLFVTTANTTGSIPVPLLDRMEIIRLPGYLDFEKVAIAKNYLIPKLIKELGVEKLGVDFHEDALEEIIRSYTRESGVREMERQISSMLRKTAVEIANGKKPRKITYPKRKVHELLGAPKYKDTTLKLVPTIGYSLGLAWTEVGGEVLPVEVMTMKGKGKLTLTGSLGEVMQESAKAALSYIRNHARSFGISEDFFDTLEMHVHVPEGSVPKDGPSAGITMLTAMLSTLTSIPVRCDVAMTGEITLTGDIFPIGGLNEKLLAAKRNNVFNIILPEKNRKDMSELAEDLLRGLKLHFVKTIAEAIPLALERNPMIPLKHKSTRVIRPSATPQ